MCISASFKKSPNRHLVGLSIVIVMACGGIHWHAFSDALGYIYVNASDVKRDRESWYVVGCRSFSIATEKGQIRNDINLDMATWEASVMQILESWDGSRRLVVCSEGAVDAHARMIAEKLRKELSVKYIFIVRNGGDL